MKDLILELIGEIEELKQNRIPAEALICEVQRKIQERATKQIDEMIENGILEVVGTTINKDSLLRVKL